MGLWAVVACCRGGEQWDGNTTKQARTQSRCTECYSLTVGADNVVRLASEIENEEGQSLPSLCSSFLRATLAWSTATKRVDAGRAGILPATIRAYPCFISIGPESSCGLLPGSITNSNRKRRYLLSLHVPYFSLNLR